MDVIKVGLGGRLLLLSGGVGNGGVRSPWLLAVGKLLEQLAPMQAQQDQAQQQAAEKGKNPLPRAVYPNVACPADECRARATSS